MIEKHGTFYIILDKGGLVDELTNAALSGRKKVERALRPRIINKSNFNTIRSLVDIGVYLRIAENPDNLEVKKAILMVINETISALETEKRFLTHTSMTARTASKQLEKVRDADPNYTEKYKALLQFLLQEAGAQLVNSPVALVSEIQDLLEDSDL